MTINTNLQLVLPEYGTLDKAFDGQAFVSIKGQLELDGNPVDAAALLAFLQASGIGPDSFRHVSGTFWVAYADGKGSVWLLNDHMGIQPCYYSRQGQCLYVASSLMHLKGLPEVTLTLSEQAIFNYFYFHCIPAPTTIYKQVEKLEPAKAVHWNSQAEFSSLLCYCPRFTHEVNDDARGYQQCLSTLDGAVEKAITPECGAFLSGGLDSSSVAGMLSRHTAARTFSVGFEAKGYDETEFALITAKHFNTQHEVLYLKPAQVADAFVKVAQYFDEPFGNSSAMAAYFCASFAKSHGVNKLLAGDGGDEIFAGNARYAKQKVFEPYLALPAWLRAPLRGIFVGSPLSGLPGFKKVASYIRQAEVRLPGRLQTYNFIKQLGAGGIFSADFLAKVDQTLPERQFSKRYHECSSDRPIDAMLFLDWKFTLADNDLVKVSKMCEMAGVEVAYPFLDKEMVDFSCTVPDSAKLPGQKLRHFYRQACRGFLADETLDKEKHGFGLPFGVWMRENEQLRTLSLEMLQRFRERHILSDSLIDQVLEAHKTVHASYYGELIWIIVVLELWLQKHEDE
ncbi:asparagine synthetase B family protein [Bowmanella dokdonensis]|uniref:asparagine synthetase B family protein n=1 Tax=Bowmanella dokdonensis TaxID=751969 RepID=UPI001F49FBAE|nr:asparagine synthase-related protein [Bowmanella dokdonensis]